MTRIIVTVLLSCMLLACRLTDEARWTEEVKLHDGRKIQVERYVTRGSSDFPNPGRGSLGKNYLVYAPMGVHWQNEPRDAAWILSFDIVDGTPYLVIDSAYYEYCKAHGPETYDVRFFKWQNGTWQLVTQDTFPIDSATLNVSRHYWGGTAAEDANGFMSWSQKATSEPYSDNVAQSLRSWLNERGGRTCGSRLPQLYKKVPT